MNGRMGAVGSALLPALLLLLVGLVIDRGFVGARRDEVTRLAERRDALRSQIADQDLLEQQGLEMAKRLGGNDLPSALVAQQAFNPISFLSGAVAQAGLHGLELGTEATDVSGNLRRTRYSIHATSGGLRPVQEFVRRIEGDPRVMSIDGFTVDKIVGEEGFDVRISLSLYEPVTGARP